MVAESSIRSVWCGVNSKLRRIFTEENAEIKETVGTETKTSFPENQNSLMDFV